MFFASQNLSLVADRKMFWIAQKSHYLWRSQFISIDKSNKMPINSIDRQKKTQSSFEIWRHEEHFVSIEMTFFSNNLNWFDSMMINRFWVYCTCISITILSSFLLKSIRPALNLPNFWFLSAFVLKSQQQSSQPNNSASRNCR